MSLGIELGTMLFQLFGFILVIAVWWLVIRAAVSFFRTARRAADTLERVATLLERVEKKLDESK